MVWMTSICPNLFMSLVPLLRDVYTRAYLIIACPSKPVGSEECPYSFMKKEGLYVPLAFSSLGKK